MNLKIIQKVVRLAAFPFAWIERPLLVSKFPEGADSGLYKTEKPEK